MTREQVTDITTTGATKGRRHLGKWAMPEVDAIALLTLHVQPSFPGLPYISRAIVTRWHVRRISATQRARQQYVLSYIWTCSLDDCYFPVTNKRIPSPADLFRHHRHALNSIQLEPTSAVKRFIQNPYTLPPILFCVAILGVELVLDVCVAYFPFCPLVSLALSYS